MRILICIGIIITMMGCSNDTSSKSNRRSDDTSLSLARRSKDLPKAKGEKDDPKPVPAPKPLPGYSGPIVGTGIEFIEMCALYPSSCAFIAASNNCASWAEKQTGGDTNALRHQCWMCVLTAMTGDPDLAKKIGDIHEGSSDLTDKGNLADSCEDEGNNRIGCQLGSELVRDEGRLFFTALRSCTQKIIQSQYHKSTDF